MSIGGDTVLKVSTQASEFRVDWLNQEWGEWKELIENPDYKALVKVAADKMESERKRLDKGKGKRSSPP